MGSLLRLNMASNNIDMSTTGKKGEQEPQHTQVHGTLENQSDLHGRIRLARRQNRFLHEQASSSLDGVIPMHYKTIDHDKKVIFGSDVPWEEFVASCDAWRNDIQWETIDE